MSTYSPNLAIQLIATNDQAGQWGLTTNVNLGTLLESAISGYVTQAFSDANVVLPMPLGADGGNGSVANPVAARNMFITCQGTNTAQRSLFVPNNTKLYFISNQTTGGFGINVTTVGGTGIVVPNGQTALLVCNGINVVNAVNYIPGLNLLTPLVLPAPASGTTLTVNALTGNTPLKLSGGAGLQVVLDNNDGIQVTPSNTGLITGLLLTDLNSSRVLEILYPGSSSSGAYGSAPTIPVINAQGGLTLSVGDLAKVVMSSLVFAINAATPTTANDRGMSLIGSGAGDARLAIATSTLGNAQLNLDTFGVQNWVLGNVRSDGSFRISNSQTLGTFDRLQISSTGTTTFLTPSSGPTVIVNGAANSNIATFLGSSTVGQSFGVSINAGTNASDRALHITNRSGFTFLDVLGDGSTVVGVPTGGGKGTGALNAQSVWISGDQIFSGVPPSSSTTISRADINKCVVATGTITVPDGVFNQGDCVSVYNDSAASITLSAGITTMRLVGTATTGSRTIAQRGMATIWFRSGTECVVSGGGVT